MARSWPVEQEVKLRVASRAEALRRLEAAGAVVCRATVRQDDILFDTPDRALERRGCALRVRREGPNALVTFKGPRRQGLIKAREEIETPVGDADALAAVLGAIGFEPAFRYQKDRQEFVLGGTIAALDDTPIGTFIELEGDETGIARAAGALGFGPSEYVADSYATLYRRECVERGLPVTHMLFGDAAPDHGRR